MLIQITDELIALVFMVGLRLYWLVKLWKTTTEGSEQITTQIFVYFPLFAVGSAYSLDDLNAQRSCVMRVASEPRTKSIQERCGINTTFPGITEYMKRYNMKRLPDKVTAFNINPTPDFSVYGRPTAKVSSVQVRNNSYESCVK